MLLRFVSLLAALSAVSSFGPPPQLRSSSSCTSTPSKDGSSSTATALPVLIYGWDGEEDECATDIFGDDDATSGAAATGMCSPVGVALAETIQGSQDKVGTLARLAVAFSPPERKIDLDAIDTVQIMCVSESQIEIEAMLCESHGCVSLMVPIQFPHDCGPTADENILEQCVLDNLHYLDMEADTVIGNMVKANKMATEAENNDELRQLEAQLTSNAAVYPSWWVAPSTGYELVAECDNIKRLLSDDEFQNDVNALARKGLEALGLGGDYVVRKAVVTAVGPAGLCLRAMADFSGSTVLMDVPLPFGGEPQSDPQALRAAVLGEVAAANVL
mmetsp:Transcript_6030/g.13129  ORF Transcript_6030/g.13129 Transcript_6030/m.13129 type:complete len:331 (-) Transcript_6030:249-1241(-)|eukprot:CAMPEP_0178483832 /NCGR_PEP_ID=MMETSP0696-20121128/7438_1 /TAXON_ID=265572 /ORGANISM="Extubocellulus spinifer, Strain CCMP396" /LENGTH=330 /DNA_ID=CAMNT_0020111363 /DNA_START=98 /DNA_END=1090 /DNA_ORIENTATION=+